MKTNLYYSDPNMTTWQTVITNKYEKDNNYFVILEETAFYPEGGGQPADHGTINGVEVIDVQEDGTSIVHQVTAPLNIGEADCQIDKQRRIDHTQHHTGQHLLSAVCIELFELETLSFHLGSDTVSIDLDTPSISDDQLFQVEQQVNKYIFENRKIKTYYVSNDELPSLRLRKLPKVSENIRIVEITGIDVSACCGTHVESTGQIGMLKLLKTEKHRGKTRLYFVCGFKALADYGSAHSVISNIGLKLSTSRENFVNKLDKMEQERRQLQKDLSEVKSQLFSYVADHIIHEANDHVIHFISKDYSSKDLQIISKQILAKQQAIVLLLSTIENRLLIAQDGKFDIHIGAMVKEHAKEYEGKGGGNDKQAQVSFSSTSDATKFLTFVKEYTKNSKVSEKI
ncbi:DHHA1 domain-containing protein [Bacillus sp. SM2101]|uniref:alanyl-tRNA editing protein n=1 Tax=Bacillus sp. SM2101 TaxID=2805366 RepID=UPI001BDDF364|nr:DHHA1 domain-containing protein [Bacillus sp. SM2101]